MPTFISRFPFAYVFRSRRSNLRAPRLEVDVAAPPLPSTRHLELEEVRGAAMRRMFPKLFGWCADRWDRGMAVEVHAYLAQATSLADLEQRIRAVERKRHFAS